MDWEIFKGVLDWMFLLRLKNIFINILNIPRLRQLMEFPVLFLGALPEDTPALYSLMNYADIKGGTWYPEGGMYAVVKAMYKLAMELGVKFCFNEEVKQIFSTK